MFCSCDSDNKALLSRLVTSHRRTVGSLNAGEVGGLGTDVAFPEVAGKGAWEGGGRGCGGMTKQRSAGESGLFRKAERDGDGRCE